MDSYWKWVRRAPTSLEPEVYFGPQVVRVTFHTNTGLGEEALYRHVDKYRWGVCRTEKMHIHHFLSGCFWRGLPVISVLGGLIGVLLLRGLITAGTGGKEGREQDTRYKVSRRPRSRAVWHACPLSPHEHHLLPGSPGQEPQ
jgi:hypothetical protein